MTISMNMVIGMTWPTTDRFGIPRLRWVGCLIASGTGPGLVPGVGLGWETSPGDFVLSTTADGFTSESPGDGCLDPSFRCQSLRQVWSHFSEALASQSEST